MKYRCTLCSWEKLIMRVTGIQANRFALLWCCQWAEWECTHASICGCICVFCVILINVASQQKAFLCTCHFRTYEVCACVCLAATSPLFDVLWVWFELAFMTEEDGVNSLHLSLSIHTQPISAGAWQELYKSSSIQYSSSQTFACTCEWSSG